LKDNKNSLIPLLFYSKVFQEEKIMLSLKSLIETDTYNFFYKLFLLSEVENYNMINEIIALYSQNKSVQKIEIEDLS
jgi:hypothetical protein